MAITPVDLQVTNITATSARLGWKKWKRPIIAVNSYIVGQNI